MSYVKSINGYVIKDEEARTAIDEEIINRTNAISAEELARNKAIEAEAAARSEADTALQTDIDSLKNYVTPEMFGAAGDGVTDDTEAIQAAINSEASIVVFPKGTYLVNQLNTDDVKNSCIELKNNLTLIGYDAKIITNKNEEMPASPYTCYKPIFSGNNIENFNIYGFEFDSFTCAYLLNSKNFKVSDIRSIHTDVKCSHFLLDGCNDFVFDSIYMADTTNDTQSDGIHLNDGNSNGIFNNIYGNTHDDFIPINAVESFQSHEKTGIENLTFTNCRTLQNAKTRRAIRIYGSGQNIDNIIFNSCEFISNDVNESDGWTTLLITNNVGGSGDSALNKNTVGKVIFNDCLLQTDNDQPCIKITQSNISNLTLNNCSFKRNKYVSGDNNIININNGVLIDSLDIHNSTENRPNTVRLMYLGTECAIGKFIYDNFNVSSYSDNGFIYITGSINELFVENGYVDSVGGFIRTANSNVIIDKLLISNVVNKNGDRLLMLINGKVNNLIANNISDCANFCYVGEAQDNLVVSLNNVVTDQNINFAASATAQPNIRLKNGAIVNFQAQIGMSGDTYKFVSDTYVALRMYMINSWQPIASASA